MDPAGELTELLETERELVARLRDQLRRGRRILGQPRLGDAKPELERDQALLRAVVEVPLEPPPLGVARLDDARARRGQLLARLRVGERDRDEARELLEPLLDAGREPAGAAAVRDRGGAPEPPRHHDRSGHSRAHLGGEHVLVKVGRLRLQVDPRRSARLRDARDRAALERERHAERTRRTGRPVARRPRSPPRPDRRHSGRLHRRRAPNSRPISSETTPKSRSGSSSVATATATRLRAACSSARVASSSRACAFASATATRPANFPSRSSAFAANCRSRVTETTSPPQRSPDTTIGAATTRRDAERDQPLVELRRKAGFVRGHASRLRRSARPPRALRPARSG